MNILKNSLLYGYREESHTSYQSHIASCSRIREYDQNGNAIWETMRIEKKIYNLPNGTESISYEVTITKDLQKIQLETCVKESENKFHKFKDEFEKRFWEILNACRFEAYLEK